MRLRPEQHLRRQSDIRAVREQGRRIDGGAFTLWWRLRAPGEIPLTHGPRLCAVASHAAVGRAVQRNRAKRRFRELFRQHQPKIAPSLDLMLLARAKANQLDFSELESIFLQVLSRIPAPAPAPAPDPGSPHGDA
jgi:ribonuclease P protein component